MSELINGKEAKMAWAEGEDVQISFNQTDWADIASNDRLLQFEQPCGFYRIKPRTISLNGIVCQSEDEALKLVKEFFR